MATNLPPREVCSQTTETVQFHSKPEQIRPPKTNPKRRESMRRLFTGLFVVLTAMFVPLIAEAGNQETANEIAKNLRDSGKLSVSALT